jgi:hypothetical protein
MSDSLPGAMPDPAERVGPATARLVLALDTAITAFRAGMSTGLPALYAASRALTDVTDDPLRACWCTRPCASAP